MAAPYRRLSLEEPCFLMRQFEEFFEQTKLIHCFHRRGMAGVAAEIAEEISMLFEDERINACAREKKTQHHSGGPAAHDAAAAGNRFFCLAHRKLPFQIWVTLKPT